MKKIYLMSLASMLTLTISAQQLKVKLKNHSSDIEKTNPNSKIYSPTQIAGTLLCNTQYVAGTTMNLKFTLTLTNTDGEYGDFASITFPTGITPNTSASNSNPIGPDDGDPLSDGPEVLNTIVGQTISWGNNDDDYGGIVAGDVYTFTVNVNVGAITGVKTASFTVSGDQFVNTGGTAGNLTNGTVNIYPFGSVDMMTKFVVASNITAINNCSIGTGSIVARFVNMGTTPQSNIPANYSVNGVASTSVAVTGPIAPGDSVTFFFPTTFNFNTSGMYTIKSWVSQPADIAKTNDTSVVVISNTIPTALTSSTYTNGIETAYDYGSINKDWTGSGLPFGLSGTAHSGTQALFYTVPTVVPAGVYTAFLNLPCVDVVTGETYKISYWKRTNNSPVANGMSGIYTGTAQNAAAMTTVIKAPSAISPVDTWIKDSANYLATTTGTRYFSISGTGTVSGTSQINVRIDDIRITKTVGDVGVSEIANNNNSISIFPNPNNGVVTISVIENNSSVEIFNVLGEIVLSRTQLSSGNNTIDLSHLTSGTYIVKAKTNNEFSTKRIVVSK